jgi:ribonuclease D
MSNKQILAYAMDYEAGHRIIPPNGWRPKWKKDFAQIIADLAEADPKTWPQRIKKAKGRLSDEERTEVEKLCQFRDEQAGQLGLESSLLGSRSTLEAVIASEAGELDLLEWQRELLAKGISDARRMLKKSAPSREETFKLEN